MGQAKQRGTREERASESCAMRSLSPNTSTSAMAEILSVTFSAYADADNFKNDASLRVRS